MISLKIFYNEKYFMSKQTEDERKICRKSIAQLKQSLNSWRFKVQIVLQSNGEHKGESFSY
jgi:hypothetical protein